MAGDASGKRKLEEQLLQPGLILADVGIYLAVGAFEIGISNNRRTAMSRTGDVDHVQVVLFDDPVQMRVDEVLAWGRAPMAQQHVLHIRKFERPLQQGIGKEIDLADREVVRGPPVGIYLVKD